MDAVSSLSRRARAHAALGDPNRLRIVDQLAVSDRSPRELSESCGMPSNLVAHHLQVLERAGLVRRARSEGDRRRTYVQLVECAVAGLVLAPEGLVDPAVDPRRVVFVCTRNSARSQLAAATWAASSSLPAASAGTRPASAVHPKAAAVARDGGLDLSRAHPAHVSEVLDPDDLVVAVCDAAHEHMPGPAVDRLHWAIPDPARLGTDAAFRSAFDVIHDRVQRLAAATGSLVSSGPAATGSRVQRR